MTKKKETVRIILWITAAVFIAIAGWFINAFFGNPVSAALARHTAGKRLEEQYAGTDYRIERVAYSFKDSCYHAFIVSPSSADTKFSFTISLSGKLLVDSYENVTSGWVTAMRLDEEYRALADSVFDSDSFPYECDISFGMLEFCPEGMEAGEETGIASYAIDQSSLVRDGEYDIRLLGSQAGHLIIYVSSDTPTPEKAAEIMQDIRRIFDREGVPFAAVDLTLRVPKPDEGPWPEEFVSITDLRYDEIEEPDLADRIREADEEIKRRDAQERTGK